VLKP
jgi:nitroreductase